MDGNEVELSGVETFYVVTLWDLWVVKGMSDVCMLTPLDLNQRIELGQPEIERERFFIPASRKNLLSFVGYVELF
jgi:hypothetical protein